MNRIADVASEPEKPVNRLAGGGFPWPRRAEPAAIGVIVLAWVAQFVAFSLERLLNEGETQSWPMLRARAVVSAIGVLLSLGILKLLQREAGTPIFKRALIALGLALTGATVHSVLNTWVFTAFYRNPGDGFSVEAFAALVYLFSWVYLAVTIVLLSLTYGEELRNRERRIAELADIHRAREEPPHLWLRKGGEKLRVDVARIDWVAAEGECVRFHCGADSYLERQSLGAVEEKLAPLGFVRIHRSAVVNGDRIERLARTPSGALQARLSTGTELRVSKSFQPAVRRLLQANR